MTECNTKIRFVFGKNNKIEADFKGGDLSSDGGILVLRELEERLKLIEGLSNCITDQRDANRITHTQQELLRQRIFQISAGYEDCNDSNYLRTDPVMRVTCNESLGSAKELGSQPTLSRLENRINKTDIKKMRNYFLSRFIEQYKEAPKEIVLDVDSYSDKTHGNQEQTYFHGFYNSYMYHPVLINEAKSGFPLVLQLRAGNCHSGKGIKGILRWVFWRLKKAFPDVNIIIRGDSGFSLPEIISVCDKSEVQYVFGYAKNAVLQRKIEFLSEEARLQFVVKGEKARLFDDVYYKSSSWLEPRRIVMKAEHMKQGTNQRFVVTNMSLPAQKLYDEFYVQRGEDSENRIKELKLDIQADRLSCHKFIANQFRLYLHQASYLLLQNLKSFCVDTELAKVQVGTLRNRLIKLAVRVRFSARRIWVQFASSCSVKNILATLSSRMAQEHPA